MGSRGIKERRLKHESGYGFLEEVSDSRLEGYLSMLNSGGRDNRLSGERRKAADFEAAIRSEQAARRAAGLRGGGS
jgi:hypothetical protein